MVTSGAEKEEGGLRFSQIRTVTQHKRFFRRLMPKGVCFRTPLSSRPSGLQRPPSSVGTKEEEEVVVVNILPVAGARSVLLAEEEIVDDVGGGGDAQRSCWPSLQNRRKARASCHLLNHYSCNFLYEHKTKEFSQTNYPSKSQFYSNSWGLHSTMKCDLLRYT